MSGLAAVQPISRHGVQRNIRHMHPAAVGIAEQSLLKSPLLTRAFCASVRTIVYVSPDTKVFAFVGTSVFSTDSGLEEQPFVPARWVGAGPNTIEVLWNPARGQVLFVAMNA